MQRCIIIGEADGDEKGTGTAGLTAMAGALFS